ncbi:MAG: hypothetical protein IPH20_25140 [Bacteroidales bacterium]|nr:hypothetical protein [Bacteroidales bacterium]
MSFSATEVVVKFVGDSGDGMQPSGTLFSDTAALTGSASHSYCFPIIPLKSGRRKIPSRGVSGFQVHVQCKED